MLHIAGFQDACAVVVPPRPIWVVYCGLSGLAEAKGQMAGRTSEHDGDGAIPHGSDDDDVKH